MRQLHIFDDLSLNSLGAGIVDTHQPFPLGVYIFLVHTRMKARAQFPGTGSLLPPHVYYRLSVLTAGAFRC